MHARGGGDGPRRRRRRAPPPPVRRPVTPENFARAEIRLISPALVKEGGLGKFAPPPRSGGARPSGRHAHESRHALTSAAVFDLGAGPVTITLPSAAIALSRCRSSTRTATRSKSSTAPGATTLEAGRDRLALCARRRSASSSTPANPKDVDAVHALQNAIHVDQPGGPGAFSVPNWDAASQVDVRSGLLRSPKRCRTRGACPGARGAGDPVRRLIGAGAAWGGLPEQGRAVRQRRPGPQRRKDRLSPDAQGRAGRRLLVGQRL